MPSVGGEAAAPVCCRCSVPSRPGRATDGNRAWTHSCARLPGRGSADPTVAAKVAVPAGRVPVVAAQPAAALTKEWWRPAGLADDSRWQSWTLEGRRWIVVRVTPSCCAHLRGRDRLAVPDGLMTPDQHAIVVNDLRSTEMSARRIRLRRGLALGDHSLCWRHKRHCSGGVP